jgi:hypothetical protein
MVVKLKNVRLAFSQNLFKPGTMAGDTTGKPAFSSTFLIPKGNPQIGELNKIIEKVAVDKWGAQKGPGVLKSLYAADKVCLHNGEAKEQYEGFDGCYYIAARSYVAPLVIDSDKAPLVEASGKPYAGCYVNAIIDVWAQDNTYGKRVNATVKGVQFYKDGDAFVGSAPATEDDFEDVGNTGDADSLV